MRIPLPRMRARLLRTSAATLSVVAVIGVLSQADGMPVSAHPMEGGGAWFASLPAGQVTLIDGPSKQVAAHVDVAPAGTLISVVQAGSDAYVVNRTTGAVRRVDGATTTASQDVQIVPGAGSGLQVFAGERFLYVLDSQRGAVTVADPRLRNWQPPASLAATVADGAVDREGRLWILDGASGDLVSLDERGRTAITGLVAPDGARLEPAGDRIAVVDRAARRVHVVDPDRRRVVDDVCLDVAADDGSVHVTGSPDVHRVHAVSGQRGALITTDLDTGDCSGLVQVAEPGDRLGTPQEAHGRVFVPNLTTGQVAIVDVDRREVTATADLFDTATRFELLAKGGIVFYNDPQSERAGVIDLDGTVHPIDKYAPSDAGGGSGGGGDDGDGEGDDDKGDKGDDGDRGDRRDHDGRGRRGTGDRGDGKGDDRRDRGDGDRRGRDDDAVMLDPVDPGDADDLPDLDLPPVIGEDGQPLPGATEPPTGSEPPTDELPPQIAGIGPAGPFDTGQTVTFVAAVTGTVEQWQWQVSGPGGTGSSTAPNLTHTLAAAGDYTVTVTATNAWGSDTRSITVTAATAVTAPSGSIACTGSQVGETLTCSYQHDGGDPPDTYTWQLAGPDAASGSGATFHHDLTAAGTYQVTLVAGNAGGSDNDAADITVTDAPEDPTVALQCTTSPSPPKVGGTVSCTAATTGDIATLEWSWIPPTSGAWRDERDSLSETFWQAGNHRITVYGYDGNGDQVATDEIVHDVSAPDPPEINSVTCTSPHSHGSSAFYGEQPLTCTADVDGDVDGYRWVMSGGVGGEQTTPTFSTTLPDVDESVQPVGYTVELRVTNAGGEDTGAAFFNVYSCQPDAMDCS